MKVEIEQRLPDVTKTEVSVKKKQSIEYVFEGTIKPKKGQKIWEINQETGIIKPADYKSDTIVINNLAKLPAEKLIINPDCIYIPALNAENAKRKYLKNKDQSFYFFIKPDNNINPLT